WRPRPLQRTWPSSLVLYDASSCCPLSGSCLTGRLAIHASTSASIHPIFLLEIWRGAGNRPSFDQAHKVGQLMPTLIITSRADSRRTGGGRASSTMERSRWRGAASLATGGG